MAALRRQSLQESRSPQQQGPPQQGQGQGQGQGQQQLQQLGPGQGPGQVQGQEQDGWDRRWEGAVQEVRGDAGRYSEEVRGDARRYGEEVRGVMSRCEEGTRRAEEVATSPTSRLGDMRSFERFERERYGGSGGVCHRFTSRCVA